MKEAEHSNWKANFDIRKRPINGKLFQNEKVPMQELLAPKKSMGKKYMQEQNIFKQKFEEPKKEHREIVMSEEFIRSSKLFRLLKEKMDRCDSMYIKEVNILNEVKIIIIKQKMKLKEDIMMLKSENYQEKIGLWELKNKLMELKTMYHEEEEESRRLGEENYAEYEGEMEGEENEMKDDKNESERENEESHEELEEQKNEDLKNSVNMEVSMNKPEFEADDKNQFEEILEELMNFKAERNRLQKDFSSKEVELPEKEETSMYQSDMSQESDLSQKK